MVHKVFRKIRRKVSKVVRRGAKRSVRGVRKLVTGKSKKPFGVVREIVGKKPARKVTKKAVSRAKPVSSAKRKASLQKIVNKSGPSINPKRTVRSALKEARSADVSSGKRKGAARSARRASIQKLLKKTSPFLGGTPLAKKLAKKASRTFFKNMSKPDTRASIQKLLKKPALGSLAPVGRKTLGAALGGRVGKVAIAARKKTPLRSTLKKPAVAKAVSKRLAAVNLKKPIKFGTTRSAGPARNVGRIATRRSVPGRIAKATQRDKARRF